MVGDADDLLAAAARAVSVPRRPIVLLVEDDPAVRTGLIRGLRRAGYACLEAAGAGEGIEMAQARKPDVVLIDRQIPGGDGLTVLKELRREPGLAELPAIVMTGHAKAETAREITALDAEFIPKPFGLATLVSAVDRLTGRSSA